MRLERSIYLQNHHHNLCLDRSLMSERLSCPLYYYYYDYQFVCACLMLTMTFLSLPTGSCRSPFLALTLLGSQCRTVELMNLRLCPWLAPGSFQGSSF